MTSLHKIASLFTAGIAAMCMGKIAAQSPAGKLEWETLMRAPVPEGSLPNISVVGISVAPAPPVPRDSGSGHTHPGPVFAYIVQGEIENQVEPDPPAFYKRDGFFSEAPMHVHRFLRNRSATEPAGVIVFQEGADRTIVTPPAIKWLLEEPLPSTANREVSLLRLTLPAGGVAEDRAHSGPGIVYVLEGKIETSGAVHSTGDLFLEPAEPAELTFTNASDVAPAKLLLYQVDERRGGNAAP